VTSTTQSGLLSERSNKPCGLLAVYGHGADDVGTKRLQLDRDRYDGAHGDDQERSLLKCLLATAPGNHKSAWIDLDGRMSAIPPTAAEKRTSI
jgi:hypothetical protein